MTEAHLLGGCVGLLAGLVLGVLAARKLLPPVVSYFQHKSYFRVDVHDCDVTGVYPEDAEDAADWWKRNSSVADDEEGDQGVA